jgi:hypothetical protein
MRLSISPSGSGPSPPLATLLGCEAGALLLRYSSTFSHIFMAYLARNPVHALDDLVFSGFVQFLELIDIHIVQCHSWAHDKSVVIGFEANQYETRWCDLGDKTPLPVIKATLPLFGVAAPLVTIHEVTPYRVNTVRGEGMVRSVEQSDASLAGRYFQVYCADPFIVSGCSYTGKTTFALNHETTMCGDLLACWTGDPDYDHHNNGDLVQSMASTTSDAILFYHWEISDVHVVLPRKELRRRVASDPNRFDHHRQISFKFADSKRTEGLNYAKDNCQDIRTSIDDALAVRSRVLFEMELTRVGYTCWANGCFDQFVEKRSDGFYLISEPDYAHLDSDEFWVVQGCWADGCRCGFGEDGEWCYGCASVRPRVLNIIHSEPLPCYNCKAGTRDEAFAALKKRAEGIRNRYYWIEREKDRGEYFECFDQYNIRYKIDATVLSVELKPDHRYNNSWD